MITELFTRSCGRCGSKLCLTTSADDIYFVHSCLSCGFETDSSKVATSFDKEAFEEHLPYLYKDLAFVDLEGLIWYPSFKNFPNGLVFANGKSIQDWSWAAILKKELTEEDIEKGLNKFGQEKTDSKSLKTFDQYIHAVHYAMSGKTLEESTEFLNEHEL